MTKCGRLVGRLSALAPETLKTRLFGWSPTCLCQGVKTQTVSKILAGLAALLCTIPAVAQVDLQIRSRQLPGWDLRAREGRCEVKVWVDNRAEVRMRGDRIFVRTLEGSRAHNEDSQCSQSLPLNAVADFRVNQLAGRSRINLVQPPNRGNNFTALIEIEDQQGGGDNYAFEVTWRAEPNVTNSPAPFFDEVRACQDLVRRRFQAQNGAGAYLDFDNFADRQGQDNDRMGNGNRRNSRNNNGTEMIRGQGTARSRDESRDVTYSCTIDTSRNRVISGIYRYTGEASRSFGNTRLR